MPQNTSDPGMLSAGDVDAHAGVLWQHGLEVHWFLSSGFQKVELHAQKLQVQYGGLPLVFCVPLVLVQIPNELLQHLVVVPHCARQKQDSWKSNVGRGTKKQVVHV